jgi:hypothetical protein
MKTIISIIENIIPNELNETDTFLWIMKNQTILQEECRKKMIVNDVYFYSK